MGKTYAGIPSVSPAAVLRDIRPHSSNMEARVASTYRWVRSSTPVTTTQRFMKRELQTLRKRFGTSNTISIFLILVAALAFSGVFAIGAHFGRTTWAPPESVAEFGVDPPLHYGHTSSGDSISFTPFPQDDVKAGVSIVAACRNRHQTLAKTFRSWLNLPHVSEIVLVDWSSSPPLWDAIADLAERDQRVRVLRVENETSWVLSRAFNLGVAASSKEYVLRTDCDYLLQPSFVRAHSLLRHSKQTPSKSDRPNKHHFYAGNYQLARNENEVHLNGAVFIRRKDFLDSGGYDERIQTYGWDDTELYNRLESDGLARRNVSYDHIAHMNHGDAARRQRNIAFAQVEIDLNALLLASLRGWSAKLATSDSMDEAATSWEHVRRNDMGRRYTSVVAKRSPKSLRDLVNATVLEEAWNTALGRRLNNEYFVPWDILRSVTVPMKVKLLQQLINVQNDHSEKPDELSKAWQPRIVFVHAQHGLGNRLRAIASAMAFAKATKRVPVVVWESDSHIAAQFGDLFEPEVVHISKFHPSWPFTHHWKWDSAWQHFLSFNYQEMEGHGAKKDEWIENDPAKHVYFKSSCIMNTNPSLSNWDSSNSMLRSLRPVETVRAAVREHEEQHELSKRIGVHIRDRTLGRDIKNVNFTNEYGTAASSTMEYWRQKSSYKTFAKEMGRIVANESDTTFYVATDTRAIIDELKRLFPGRIVVTPRDCDGRDAHCVKYALIDIISLSKTRKLYGSNWSSFTEAAERYGGLKANLAGLHFEQDDKVPT